MWWALQTMAGQHRRRHAVEQDQTPHRCCRAVLGGIPPRCSPPRSPPSLIEQARQDRRLDPHDLGPSSSPALAALERLQPHRSHTRQWYRRRRRADRPTARSPDDWIRMRANPHLALLGDGAARSVGIRALGRGDTPILHRLQVIAATIRALGAWVHELWSARRRQLRGTEDAPRQIQPRWARARRAPGEAGRVTTTAHDSPRRRYRHGGRRAGCSPRRPERPPAR